MACRGAMQEKPASVIGAPSVFYQIFAPSKARSRRCMYLKCFRWLLELAYAV